MSGAGELLIVGVGGPALAPAERRILERVRPGGVILFGRNVESAEQLAALVEELRRAVPGTLLYLDAEGGRVDRLRGVVGAGAGGGAPGRRRRPRRRSAAAAGSAAPCAASASTSTSRRWSTSITGGATTRSTGAIWARRRAR